jgi:hypothetical protein
VSLLIEMGPPSRRPQYADNISKVALSEGSRSAPIVTPVEELNCTLNQSIAGDQHGVPTSVPKHNPDRAARGGRTLADLAVTVRPAEAANLPFRMAPSKKGC